MLLLVAGFNSHLVSRGVEGGGRDGDFTFRVLGMQTTTQANVGELPWIGTPQKPRGQFIIVGVEVTNSGKQPQSFFVQNQKLIDTQGREYTADTMAALRLNTDAMTLDLGPGFTIVAILPFDVPPGTQPQSLELHDSAFSGGVRVKLP